MHYFLESIFRVKTISCEGNLKPSFRCKRPFTYYVSHRGGWGVSPFLIFSDKGERGGKPISDFWLTRGGGGVWTPPFLADVICEQPLSDVDKRVDYSFNFSDAITIVQTW